MPRILPVLAALGTILTIFAAYIFPSLRTKAIVVGFTRPRDQILNIHGDDLKHIPETPFCEDLHLHEPSGLLFTACAHPESDLDARRKWFPPIGLLDAKHAKKQRGSIVVIDPETFKATHLALDGFEGPFITHGIDILSSDKFPNLVYIYAINHLPHPDAGKSPLTPQARSQVEIFSHTIGTAEARHLYSIAHDAIATPNDIIATSTTSFYVTNDHHYRSGSLRHLEDLGWRGPAPWSTTVHVTLDTITYVPDDPTSGINATVALRGLHNNNGLGHGESDDILLIGSAASGELTRVKRTPSKPELEVLEHVQLDTTIDNPTYFTDAYATPGHDASGYILAGMTHAVELAEDVHNKRPLPCIVWHVKRNEAVSDGPDKWTKKVIFQDDGRQLSSAATAVLVGVDPEESGGKKKGWLFTTGFMSEGVVATLIDL